MLGTVLSTLPALFDPHSNPGKEQLYPHVTNEEAGPGRLGDLLRPHSWPVGEPRFGPRQSISVLAFKLHNQAVFECN